MPVAIIKDQTVLLPVVVAIILINLNTTQISLRAHKISNVYQYTTGVLVLTHPGEYVADRRRNAMPKDVVTSHACPASYTYNEAPSLPSKHSSG